MRKCLNIFIIISIIFVIINLFNINKSFAITSTTVVEDGSKGSSIINPSDYKPSDLEEDKTVINASNKIIGAFQAIGSVVSVLVLVVIGIKYMLGSVEEKAEFKNTMIYYIVGAILVFAISNISVMIYDFATTLN